MVDYNYMKMDTTNVINFDFEGWPIKKKTWREILISIGFKEENGKLSMDNNDDMLDAFPLVVEDDGMGYGVKEKYITDFSPWSENVNGTNGVLFADAELPNIDIFIEDMVLPYSCVMKDGIEYTIVGFDKEKNAYSVHKLVEKSDNKEYINREDLKKYLKTLNGIKKGE